MGVKAWVKNGDLAILVDTNREMISGESCCVVYLQRDVQIKKVEVHYRKSKL
jgi:phage repressor protein C with HTH and peptisase S24 domain